MIMIANICIRKIVMQCDVRRRVKYVFDFQSSFVRKIWRYVATKLFTYEFLIKLW